MTSTGAPGGASGSGARLFERDLDLASLAALVDATAAGNGRLVAIEGSAGVGKTSLRGEARQIAGAAGLRVLTARCARAGVRRRRPAHTAPAP